MTISSEYREINDATHTRIKMKSNLLTNRANYNAEPLRTTLVIRNNLAHRCRVSIFLNYLAITKQT